MWPELGMVTTICTASVPVVQKAGAMGTAPNYHGYSTVIHRAQNLSPRWKSSQPHPRITVFHPIGEGCRERDSLSLQRQPRLKTVSPFLHRRVAV